jgi:hypothetical protein
VIFLEDFTDALVKHPDVVEGVLDFAATQFEVLSDGVVSENAPELSVNFDDAIQDLKNDCFGFRPH